MEDNLAILLVAVCCLIEGTLSIISNALLLLVFFRNPLRNMWQCSSILIFNVSLSDLCAGLIFVYWSSSHWHSHWNQEWLETATMQAMWISTLTSTFTLVALSLERYLIVKRPWDAPQMVTKRRTIVVCVTSWIISLVLCSALANNGRAFILTSSSLLEGSVIMQILFYFLLWREIKRKGSSPPNYGSEQRQLTLVVFLLIVMLIITVLPILICYQVFTINSLTYKSSELHKLLSWLGFYLLPLYCVNFFLNPIFYVWRLKKYRRSLAAVFCKTEPISPASEGLDLITHLSHSEVGRRSLKAAQPLWQGSLKSDQRSLIFSWASTFFQLMI